MSVSEPHTQEAAGDPSMADILASIRRILSEDEPAAPPAQVAPHEAAGGDEEVLVLDRSMMVDAPEPTPHTADAPTAPAIAMAADDDGTVRMAPLPPSDHNAPTDHALAHTVSDRPAAIDPTAHMEPVYSNLMSDLTAAPVPQPAPVLPPPLPEGVSQKDAWPQPVPALAESVTVATAASSLVNLVRSVAAERTASIQRSGLSIEDVVREEVRPLLKAWLDMHLPPLVERLVQAEIERVVTRAAS